MLHEESTPVDAEVRREAEVIRQVREEDPDILQPSGPEATDTSPNLPASLPTGDSLEGIPEDAVMGTESASNSERGGSGSFSKQAARLSAGPEFWNAFDSGTKTPPNFPPASVINDVDMNSPSLQSPNIFSQPSTQLSQGMNAPQPPSAADISRKINMKRRRGEDDPFESSSAFKRRAVSPGVSVHNSPIMSQSPAKEGLWGISKGESNAATGTAPPAAGNAAGGKRVNFQGMSDTNDGLMKMSIG